jgi:hypothetical protein
MVQQASLITWARYAHYCNAPDAIPVCGAGVCLDICSVICCATHNLELVKCQAPWLHTQQLYFIPSIQTLELTLAVVSRSRIHNLSITYSKPSPVYHLLVISGESMLRGSADLSAI